jgi:hypothetical protein
VLLWSCYLENDAWKDGRMKYSNSAHYYNPHSGIDMWEESKILQYTRLVQLSDEWWLPSTTMYSFHFPLQVIILTPSLVNASSVPIVSQRFQNSPPGFARVRCQVSTRIINAFRYQIQISGKVNNTRVAIFEKWRGWLPPGAPLSDCIPGGSLDSSDPGQQPRVSAPISRRWLHWNP